MTKRIKKMRKGLLFRYFFSYLLIFLLPFLILTLALYYSSVLGVEKQLKTANMNSLRQVDTLLNERFSELDKIVDNIKINPRLSNFMLTHPYYSIEGRAELAKIQASNAFISEVFLHFNSSNKIYSSNGAQTLELFTEKKYQRYSLDQVSLRETFQKNTASLRFNYANETGEKNSLLQYYKPIISGGSVYGSAFFFIEEAELQRVLNNVTTDYNGEALVVNQEGQVIKSSHSGSISHPKSTMFDQTLLEKDELVIDNHKYRVSAVTSDVSGLTFVTIIDAKEFLQPLTSIRNAFFLLIFGFLAVGFILSYLMGLIQYRPIKKLDNAFRKITVQEEKSEDDELTLIEKRLSRFATEQQDLTATLFQQQRDLSDYFFSKVIEGQFRDKAEVEQRMTELSLSLKGKHFFVMVLGTQFSKDKEDNVKKKSVLLNALPLTIGLTKIYGVELPLKKEMALIVGTSQPKGDQCNDIHTIKKVLDELIDEDISLNVGERYEDLFYANRSYIEAMSASEFKPATTKQSVFFYKELVYSQPQFLSIPSELKSKLVQSLNQGDQAVALETIETIFSHHSLEGMNRYEAKYYYFDALSTVINSISQLGYEELLGQINEIIEYTSPKHLAQHLLKLTQIVCQKVSEKKLAATTKLESDIIVYLNRYYRSHDLSLERIAIAFDFSVSYLSRFIKEETGVTFTAYIQELRLNYIKKRLIESDDTIKEIVTSAGYYDVSNYTRKFKTIVGLTPGQYRKKKSKEKIQCHSTTDLS